MAKGELATFGAGCFWCTEAVFDKLKGVNKVVSGYAGGTIPNPTYEQVCSRKTGHAEAVQITFDPKSITYSDLLNVFWQIHDPTQLNRQGPDSGEQYRSVIFYQNAEQKRQALKSKEEIQKSHRDPVVTQIVPLVNFYPAEIYHRNYYAKNREAPYCQLVIDPKIQKLKKEFGEYLASQK